MTEDEAKTKWCPFAKSRAVMRPACDESEGFGKQAHWRNENGELSTACIAGYCMAWRKEKNTPVGRAIKEVEQPEQPESVDGAFWVSGRKESGEQVWGLFPLRGYCGLAGKP